MTGTAPPRRVRAGLDRHGEYEITGRDPFEVARAFGRFQTRNHTVGLFAALAAACADSDGASGRDVYRGSPQTRRAPRLVEAPRSK